MNVTGLINLIIEEWAYRVNDGMPNPKNPTHLKELGIVLSEMGLSHIKEELVQNLITEKGKTPQPVKEEEKSFSNPILNKKVSYKDKEGNQKDGIVGNLLRQPEGTPARDAAEKVLPPEGSPERDALNQELGGEGGKKGEEEPKSGEDKQAAEKEKQQQAQAMFDPKVDPAMAARLDKEKETQAKLAADAEKDKEAEKPKEEPKKKDGFEPIPAQDVKNEIPEADPDTFGAPSDIPDGIGKEELKKFNTDISKVQQIVADAKAKGEKAPDINLCDVTVPGTNLYCDDNLGIPRDQMPQFKGKPVPGSKAEKMPLNKDGEVDTEPVFREMLKEKGITTTQTEVPADKLKATQSELGGDKVVGMMGALEKDPNHPGITGPIYVSRDGFVIDGHHRWAAIAAYNAKYPDKQIPMKCEVVDMDIKDAIPMCNKFAEDIGIAAKKQGETTGTAGEQQPSEPAKREPANDDPESKAQKFKGKKSGEEIQTMEMEGGGFVYGTKHGNTAMVDDILDDVKSKIPKERWKDVVFVGEGGATNNAGELEFNDEMDYAAPKFKEMGASVDTFDGDDLDVHNDQSKLYQKQKEKTGLNDSQVKAGNWASMIGQGEGTDTMSPNDFLDDEGKQFLQDAAKEAGFAPIENWDEPTEQDKDTLYRLSFPEDNGDKPTKINDIQVAFNEIRDENLIEKNKELTAQGKIPITIAGESHVELVDKMSKKSKDTKKPKEKPEDTKDDKEDIKKEKPGQEATSSSGNKIYSVGGGYYSDKPNGPAKYVRTEWVVDLAFSDIITEDVFALFEKTITATLSNGKQIKVQELPPNDVKKATQKAKAAAASYKGTEQKPEAPKSETPPTNKKVAPPTRKEEPAEPGNPKGEYKPDPKLEPKVDDKGNVEGTDIPAQNEENPNPKFVNKVSTKLDDFYKDVLDEEERAQKAVIEKMKAEGKLPADFKEVHPLPFGFKHPALKDNPELQKEFSAAVKDENKPPHWDLCKVSIPGTNKFCDENIGIPRDKMPQLGGKPKPGSEGEAKAKRIADENVRKKMGLPNDGEIPADKKQEYDDLYAKENTQHVNVEKEFEDYLKSEGINVSDPVEVPASSLKATQSELVGEQIVGMVNSLEQDPNNPFITAPIMVTRDGYVIDGHHRWATIQAYNMKHTPPNGDKEPIKMKVRIVDEDIETHIPRANAFAEKMGIETMSGKGKKKDEPKPATSTKPSTLSRIKEKLKNWNKKEKEYFNMGYHKPGSDARKSISERLRDKASGAWKAVKDGFKHEVEEFKTAGKAVGKLFSKAGGWNDLSHHEKDALKAVGVKIVTTALFGAAMGGLSYGAVGFAKHVAIEFVPHVVAETFLKGAGRAALFADAEGEAEMDAQFIKFTEMIADGLENMKISPEQMEQMIDSYNKKKEEDTMKKEISIIDGIILEILNEAKKPGESKEHPGYYHRGQGYYSTKPNGEITHKTKDGVLKPLNAKEKAEKNAGKTTKQVGKTLGVGDFRDTGEKDIEEPTQTSSDNSIPSVVSNGLNNGSLDSLRSVNAKLISDRDKGIAGAGGPVASYGEAALTTFANKLQEVGGFEGYVIENGPAIEKKVGEIRKNQKAFKNSIETVARQLGFVLPKDENKVIEYIAARMVFGDDELKRLKKDKNSLWYKTGKQGFSQDEDAFRAWSRADFDGAISTRTLIQEQSKIDTSKDYIVIQSDPKKGGHDDGILNHLIFKLEEAKAKGNKEDIEHYQAEIYAFTKLGFHDTMAVGFDKKGRITVFSITNKKQDDLQDIWGNTTPEYALNLIKKSFGPKVSKTVVDVIEDGIVKVSNSKKATTQLFSKMNLNDDFVAICDTPEMKKYMNQLKGHKKFNAWLSEKKMNPKTTKEWLVLAQKYAKENEDAPYEPFGKFVHKVGELSQVGPFVRKHPEINFASAAVKKAVQTKNDEKELTAAVHRDVVDSITEADKTAGFPKKDGKNGPHTQAYLTTVMHSMHFDLMVENFDGNLGAITGIRGSVPSDFRECLAKLSGFKGEIKSKAGRDALNRHLLERCKLNPQTRAIEITNEEGTSVLAEDTWRTAGTSQKVEKKLGGGLRSCVSARIDKRQADKRAKGK